MALSNSQYGSIMREYDRRQIQGQRDKMDRIREVYSKIPVMQEMDQEIAAVSLQSARAALRKQETDAAAARRKLEDLREQKNVLLRGNGFPENYMDTWYVCPDCKDTGYIGQEKCRCFRRMEADLYLEESNLKEVLEKENFSKYESRYYDKEFVLPGLNETVFQHMNKVDVRCVRYAEDFETDKDNLLLTGPSGTGKTFFTHCIAAELLGRGIGVLYYTATELAELFAAHRLDSRQRGSENDAYQRVFDCDLLIIDDLGTEWNNALTNSELFNCLNERMRMDKPCVISTNLSLEELSDRYSERILSRIIGKYQILELVGEDIRIRKNLG